MNRIFAAVFCLTFAAPCISSEGQSCDSLSSLRWILGDWIADGSKKTFHESWKELGPKTFEGTGIERSKADGMVQGGEDLRLVEMGGAVFYVSKVTHNELPVAFRLAACEAEKFVFENPAHDFPRRLEYLRQSDDRLNVRVSDGAEKGFTLEFARAPSGTATSDALLAAEDARFAAMVQGNADAMRPWFADDLLYVHSTGAIEDREQLIASITSGRMRYVSVEPVDRRVIRSAADSAIVQGLARFRVTANGSPLEFQARYLAVYGLDGGGWRLRAWQSLRLP